MKIWIHINGVQEGPFDETSLPLDRMNAATPVWYEGLSYWMPAAKAPLTAQLLTNHIMRRQTQNTQEVPQAQNPAEPIDVEYTEEQPRQQQAFNPINHQSRHQAPQQTYTQYSTSENTATQQTRQKPSTYLIWSILLTVLCCNPIGIIPIITGTQVTSKFNNYNYEGARKSSELTEWWLMITIVTSLILAPLTMLMTL